MIGKLTILAGIVLLMAGCSGSPSAKTPAQNGPQRIVSLDYCADQYVLKLADPKNIAGLSPDAEATFSYMKEEARGFPKVRSRAEDILLLKPDMVVRTYGGGPNAVAFFERAGIEVVQIGYANDLDAVKQITLDTAEHLGEPEKGAEVVAEMKARLAAIPARTSSSSMLYLTSKGAVAGTGTMVGDLLEKAGHRNFQERPGWASIPLESLAYNQPDMIAAGFFDTNDLTTDRWTPSRHPLVRRAIQETPTVSLPGAWTSCGAWFLLDAVEALAAGGDAPVVQ